MRHGLRIRRRALAETRVLVPNALAKSSAAACSSAGAPVRHGHDAAGDDDAEELAVELGAHLCEVRVVAKRDPPLEMTCADKKSERRRQRASRQNEQGARTAVRFPRVRHDVQDAPAPRRQGSDKAGRRAGSVRHLQR